MTANFLTIAKVELKINNVSGTRDSDWDRRQRRTSSVAQFIGLRGIDQLSHKSSAALINNPKSTHKFPDLTVDTWPLLLEGSNRKQVVVAPKKHGSANTRSWGRITSRNSLMVSGAPNRGHSRVAFVCRIKHGSIACGTSVNKHRNVVIGCQMG